MRIIDNNETDWNHTDTFMKHFGAGIGSMIDMGLISKNAEITVKFEKDGKPFEITSMTFRFTPKKD